MQVSIYEVDYFACEISDHKQYKKVPFVCKRRVRDDVNGAQCHLGKSTLPRGSCEERQGKEGKHKQARVNERERELHIKKDATKQRAKAIIFL